MKDLLTRILEALALFGYTITKITGSTHILSIDSNNEIMIRPDNSNNEVVLQHTIWMDGKGWKNNKVGRFGTALQAIGFVETILGPLPKQQEEVALTRTIDFEPADETGASCNFILNGPKGALNFRFNTGMTKVNDQVKSCYGWGVGWHYEHPEYEGQKRHECDILECGYCYGNSAGTLSDHYLKILLEKGSDGLWEKMEEEYARSFTNNE